MDIKVSLAFLKDSLSVAGKTKQGVKQSRSDLIKPSLLLWFARLADTADVSSCLLIGESISDKVQNLACIKK